ncbi:MAG: type II toxin-antitoxin system MqsA family antitoxin [Coriobacteriia bacterium]|nr:type II toxin-antitoxin system MqsA family antitoxin [Coriobacteriia bacterium]
MEWPKPAGSVCASCGEPEIVVATDPIEQTVAGRTYQLDGFKYNRCAACAEEYFSAGQLDDILRAANAAARAELGRLSGDDIAVIRRGLGLTQSQLAARLGVSGGLVARWERGTVLPNAMADRYLRDLRMHPELVDKGELVVREGRGPYRPRSG